jgi:hypothetical protein
MLKMLVAQLAVATVFVGAQAPSDSIAGTWVLEFQGHQVGLGLEQDGQKLTGTLVMMGTKVLVDGEYADRRFTLASAPDEATKVKLTGKLNEDGTMEGDVETRHGTMRWKAERLKPPVSRQ